MTKYPLQQPWFRFGAAILVAGGVGISVYSVVVPRDVQHKAMLSDQAKPFRQQATAIADTLPPEARQITAYRSPTCGCCGEWVKHMQAQGFQVQDNIVEDMGGVKREHNVPEDLASCHTAIANGYVIEGHIPAADVKRLLTEKPDVVGIAVPGMPIGSPGMESGNVKDPYTVFTYNQAGQTTVFVEHNS